MKGLLELLSLVSMLATMAGLVWAAFGLMAADPMTGHAPADKGFMSGGLRFAAIAAAIFIIVSLVRKRIG